MTHNRGTLRVTELAVVYNRVIGAIHNISFEVKRKEIISVLGRNGAGKTTTLRAISGFFKAEGLQIAAGDVLWEGKSLKGKLPFEIVRSGIVLVPEREKVFETLSVHENLICSLENKSAEKSRSEILHDIFSYFPILRERQKQTAGYLSGGERQMLSIGKALLCGPRLLLIDELSLGLAPLVISNLMKILSQMRAGLDISILLVEQNAAAALEIADYGFVLENGGIVLHGTPAKLAANDVIRDFYLGTSTEKGTYRDLKRSR